MNATSGRRPSKVSDEELVDAAADASNTRQLLLLLGIAPYGGNYESIRQRLRTLGVDAPRFGTRPPPRAVDAVRLADAVRIARSYAEVARLLLLGESGAAHRRAKQLVTESGLDYSHFLGKASNRGERRGGRRGAPLSELLVQGRLYPTAALKRRLLREGLLLPRCACCGLLEWQGRVVPLELPTSTGTGRTTGSRTCASSAPTATRRPTRTAAATSVVAEPIGHATAVVNQRLPLHRPVLQTLTGASSGSSAVRRSVPGGPP
jgi:hypothetical protein